MPRELITIQVGQCGNQIGSGFWELALAEYAQYSPEGIYDESMSSFFRNVDTSRTPHRTIKVGNGTGKVSSLKARSIMVDMEEGVVSHILNSPLGELFDTTLRLTDVSGSGNNWSRGYYEYGNRYKDTLNDVINKSLEDCDSPQSFILFHSLGGGTGSGLGTKILCTLKDDYPELFRFTVSVFPSENDDVITSPYNTMFALNQLIENVDCVLPIENESLIRICNSIQKHQQKNLKSNILPVLPSMKSIWKESFQEMNHLVARVLSNLTASMRYHGDLNIDLNELCTNLIPYPRLCFILSALSPTYNYSDQLTIENKRKNCDWMIHDVIQPQNQLLSMNPKVGKILSCGLLYRGQLEVSDIYRHIELVRNDLNMIYWNQDGFKIGLCRQPALNQKSSLLMLTNNCSIHQVFNNYISRYQKLFSHKLYLHHYEEYMSIDDMNSAYNNVVDVAKHYESLNESEVPRNPSRLLPQI